MTRTRRSPNLGTTFRAALGTVALAYAGSGAAEPDTGDDSATHADAAARFDYLLHCSGCHRADGSGTIPEVPSLRGTVGSLVATSEGREYIVRVPEVAQAPLDDKDLARLLNWMLREFNAQTLPEEFQPITDREVATARTRVLADPLRARAAIVGAYESEPAGGEAGNAGSRRRFP